MAAAFERPWETYIHWTKDRIHQLLFPVISRPVHIPSLFSLVAFDLRIIIFSLIVSLFSLSDLLLLVLLLFLFFYARPAPPCFFRGIHERELLILGARAC